MLRRTRHPPTQFEDFAQRSCPANLVVFRFLQNKRKVYEIVERASKVWP
jgi:hypothetical protein